MKSGTRTSLGGGGSTGPAGAAGGPGLCSAAGFGAAAAGGFDGAGAAGFGGDTGARDCSAVGRPVAELISDVVAVVAAAGFSGFGAGGPAFGAPTAAAEVPAPGASVRDTSPLSGSPGAPLAGLSAPAWGGVDLGSSSTPTRAPPSARHSSSRPRGSAERPSSQSSRRGRAGPSLRPMET